MFEYIPLIFPTLVYWTNVITFIKLGEYSLAVCWLVGLNHEHIYVPNMSIRDIILELSICVNIPIILNLTIPLIILSCITGYSSYIVIIITTMFIPILMMIIILEDVVYKKYILS